MRSFLFMQKFIIAGSRDFSDYGLLKEKLDKLKDHFGIFEVVSGTARGADSLGEKYAEENKLPIKRFIPDWDKFGKAAGYKRNEEMAQYADGCIVFWDGKSKGTEHMINLAKKYNIQLSIINYEKPKKLS